MSENASLAESNRMLRAEKKALEDKLVIKSEELTAVQAQISPMRQEELTLQSEIEYLKLEGSELRSKVEYWQKRATTIMTKVCRLVSDIDDNAHTIPSSIVLILKLTRSSKLPLKRQKASALDWKESWLPPKRKRRKLTNR